MTENYSTQQDFEQYGRDLRMRRLLQNNQKQRQKVLLIVRRHDQSREILVKSQVEHHLGAHQVHILVRVSLGPQVFQQLLGHSGGNQLFQKRVRAALFDDLIPKLVFNYVGRAPHRFRGYSEADTRPRHGAPPARTC